MCASLYSTEYEISVFRHDPVTTTTTTVKMQITKTITWNQREALFYEYSSHVT